MNRSMLKLEIPAPLKVEFATVEALWHSTAKTKRVDALILSWVKYEKQLRRLFCFFVFRHSEIREENIDDVIAFLAENANLYPETFMAGIEALGEASVPDLLGSRYDRLWREISRIKKYRNKLMHGQITGKNIRSPQLERDVLWIVEWVASLATAGESAFGYDGLKRNTFSVARSGPKVARENYPFSTPDEFRECLSKLAKRARRDFSV